MPLACTMYVLFSADLVGWLPSALSICSVQISSLNLSQPQNSYHTDSFKFIRFEWWWCIITLFVRNFSQRRGSSCRRMRPPQLTLFRIFFYVFLCVMGRSSLERSKKNNWCTIKTKCAVDYVWLSMPHLVFLLLSIFHLQYSFSIYDILYDFLL